MLPGPFPFCTPGGGYGIQGSPSVGWSFIKTAETAAAETIARFGVSDAPSGSIVIKNGTSGNADFEGRIEGTHQGASTGLTLVGAAVTDTGAIPMMTFQARIGASSRVGNRPLFSFANFDATVLDVLPLDGGAGSALSWGAQAGGVPAFTTRPAGTRLVLASAIDGSNVDYAIGTFGGGTAGVWYSVPRAIAGFEHRFYAGTDNVATIRGDGLMTTTGGKVKKVRIALTSPVTIAVTDDIVIVDLTTPGAVTINYPASPEAGREYIVIDGKGDSGANNHTHTPAAGTINGAATAAVAANYYRRTAVYDGSKWLLG